MGQSPEALAPLPPPSGLQLQYMMVMVGYPDLLLKPEAVDKEYEVGLPSACPDQPGWPDFSRPLVDTPREAQHHRRGGTTTLR